MNDVLRIARLKIALQRAFLGRAILRVIVTDTITRMVIDNNKLMDVVSIKMAGLMLEKH